MDVPPPGTFDYSRNYDLSKKIDGRDKPFEIDRPNDRLISPNHHSDILRRTLDGDHKKDNSSNSKSESQPGRVMKDESTNTILSLGGHTSTFGMSLRDAEGKIHQPVEWNQKFDAEEIARFLDVNMAMREAEMKCHQSLVPGGQKEGATSGNSSSGSSIHPLPGTSVHVYKENLAEVMERNRALMQTAFRHSYGAGQKPFSCGICQKHFSQGSHLQQHIRTHTGERPYICDLCAGTFTRMSDLKRHMRTHTGERPYKCSACGNLFGDVSHLKSHIRTHTGEKPFECSVCGKPFARQSSLKRHMRTHSKQ
ncbi:hypothetical protein LSTR_LSTR004397 [Laodelphax striatellus]|uniref:C2H2-type domain-containing protein n=1 Tax=Laodelphax striatellus TaxID=195883 RepID=A0A482XAH7_LAOST|nr:hypothetical protein LSTR_LSTR004397 [Laodelphax striatellus]